MSTSSPGRARAAESVSPRRVSASPCSPVLSLFLLSSRQPYPFRRIRSLALRSHCRRLLAARRLEGGSLTETVARLADVLERRGKILTSEHPARFSVAEPLFRIAAYAELFVRKPSDWNPKPGFSPEDEWRSFIGHLFERWPVPPAFVSAWLTPGELRHRVRDWYCHLAAGGSLRTLPGMPPLRRPVCRFLHLGQLPGMLPAEAVRRAQLAAAGCPVEIFREVMASRAAREDFSNDSFWLPLIEKIMADPGFDPGDFGMIADAVRWEIGDRGALRARELARVPLRELGRWASQWWRRGRALTKPDLVPEDFDPRDALMRARISRSLRLRWRRFEGIDPWEMRESGDGDVSRRWVIRPMDDIAALRREGSEMEHCVGGYSRKCHRVISAIFSVRCLTPQGEPMTADDCTIEVSCTARRVAQARGRRNACPTPAALIAVSNWAAAHNIAFTPAWVEGVY